MFFYIERTVFDSCCDYHAGNIAGRNYVLDADFFERSFSSFDRNGYFKQCIATDIQHRLRVFIRRIIQKSI